VIIDELKKRKFLRVSDHTSRYLDREHLFGEAVSAAFPSAANDIKGAGNCLAAECPTAAVFHLMRAAEVCLRSLAVDRGVQYPNATVASQQVGNLVA